MLGIKWVVSKIKTNKTFTILKKIKKNIKEE